MSDLYPGLEPVFIGFSLNVGNIVERDLGKLIREFTGGDTNHAFFIYWDLNWNSWLVVGANSNGLTFQCLSEFLEQHEIVHLFGSTKFCLWDGLRAHVTDLDKGYNYTGLLNMAWVEVGKKLTGKPWGNLLSSSKRLFCSEWCSEVIKTAIMIAVMLQSEWPLFNNGYKDDQVDPAFLCSQIIATPNLWITIEKEVITKPWINNQIILVAK